MININDWTEGNLCGGGNGGGAEGGGAADPPNNSPLPALFRIYCGIFFSLQLMWLQLIIESADFHPDTHARETASAHIHTPCVRAFALFTGQNGAEPKRRHLRFHPDRFSCSLVILWSLWFVWVFCAALESHPRPGTASGCRIQRRVADAGRQWAAERRLYALCDWSGWCAGSSVLALWLVGGGNFQLVTKCREVS